ncbi:MAG: hypothetical protein GY699_19850 [Desulfobacteraceae bacterium]|nr:hypothetical protein [Desulfobacteraceae bacterium]
MKKYIVLVILIMLLIPINSFGRSACNQTMDSAYDSMEKAKELTDAVLDAIDNDSIQEAITFAEDAIMELQYGIDEYDYARKRCLGMGYEDYWEMQEVADKNSSWALKRIWKLETWIKKARKNLAEANDSIEQDSFEQNSFEKDNPIFGGYYERIAGENESRIKELENAKAGEKNRNFYVTEYRRLHGEDPKRMSVNVEKASFYSGPGTNYELLWEAEKYYPVLIVDIKGSWYKIMDVDGDMAWTDKSFLGEKDHGIITTSGRFVLSLPKKDSQALFSFDRGVPLKVLDHSGDWLKIEHCDGDIGWIEKRYVW